MSRRVFVTTFLGLVALHCVAYEPGIEAELRVSGAPPTLAFHTEAGERVELDQAVLHVDAVELRACELSYGFRSVAHRADHPALELTLDQRKLFDHEGTLTERLEAIAQLTVR